MAGYQKMKRPLPVRWKVGILLLSLVQCTRAQDPTTSPAPSNMADVDTQMPTTALVAETLLPTLSPMPTDVPSSNPSLSSQPSHSPTFSFSPTVSEQPSSNPTLSPQPTLTKMPTNSPTDSFMPTETPSGIPSVVPSEPPKVETAARFNNRMIFDGLPFLLNQTSPLLTTNATPNVTWINITSQHVITYWRNRNYTNFNITSVQTNLINQFPEPINPEAIPPIVGSRVIYDQQIQYTSWGMDSPVNYAGNDSVLFIWPFRSNSQPYVDQLQKAFESPRRIHLLEMSLARQPPPEPSSAPNGLPPFIEPDDGKMETPMIVAISLGSIAAFGIVLFIFIWWITRRKPDIMLDEEFVDGQDDNDIMLVPPPNEDPRVFVPSSSSRMMTASDITSSSQQQVGPYSSQRLSSQQEMSEREHSLADTSVGNVYIEDDENDGSLHVGIPVQGDMDGYSIEEDEDDDDDSYYYPQPQELTESVIEAHRPSMSAFGLQISELDD